MSSVTGRVGHRGGSLASKLAVQTACEAFEKAGRKFEDPKAALLEICRPAEGEFRENRAGGSCQKPDCCHESLDRPEIADGRSQQGESLLRGGRKPGGPAKDQ